MGGKPVRGSMVGQNKRRTSTFNSDQLGGVRGRRGPDSLERPRKVEEQVNEDDDEKRKPETSSGKDGVSK